MLRNFLYLNEEILDQYIGQVEDGLRSTRSRTANTEKSGSGGVDLKVASGRGEKSSGVSETEEFSDSPHARFNRLLQLVEGHEGEFGWIEVLQEVDVEGARVGAIVDVTCDLYETDLTKVTGPNGLLGLLPLVAKLQGGFESWSSTGGDMPDSAQLDAMSAFSSSMPEMILLGEVLDTAWRIVVVLPSIPGIEGQARVVGKVTKRWGADKSEPLPGVPFIEQLPREQRREFVRKGPVAGQEMMWLEGPALQIEVLAIYR